MTGKFVENMQVAIMRLALERAEYERDKARDEAATAAIVLEVARIGAAQQLRALEGEA